MNDLATLAAELTGDVSYATGARRFPRQISDEEAAELAGAVQRTASEMAQKRAEAATQHQVTIACGRNCTGCCEEMVIVSEPEALAAARWLQKPENADARAHFLAAHARWREKAGDAPERLAALTIENKDRAAYAEAHAGYWRTRNLCAFNKDGDCTIYGVRPLVCRDAHAVETNQRCFGDFTGGGQAGRIKFGPMVTLLGRAHHLMQAAHNAVAPDRVNRHQALCDAVYRLLKTSR
jgi:Fe-S-cluster containining protein